MASEQNLFQLVNDIPEFSIRENIMTYLSPFLRKLMIQDGRKKLKLNENKDNFLEAARRGDGKAAKLLLICAMNQVAIDDNCRFIFESSTVADMQNYIKNIFQKIYMNDKFIKN